MEELDSIKLREELDQFKKEKEKIRRLMAQIGGKNAEKKDLIANVVFIGAIVLLGVNDVAHYVGGFNVPIHPELSLGIAVFLISVKIVWMMHKATRVEHFQFWILNSIEFRLDDVARHLRRLEETVEKYHSAGSDKSEPPKKE